MNTKIVELEKRLKDLENYVYNFEDFLPARSLVEETKNYLEKLESVTVDDLTKRFHIPEARAKKLIELFIEYGFLIKNEKDILKVNPEAFRSYSPPTIFTGEPDSMYEEAKKIVQAQDKASPALLQRRLSIGYARAARIMDQLEADGIVGPPDGAKPRQVLKR